MNKVLILVGVIALSISICGCGKKKETLQEMQEPMSIESLSTINAETMVPVGDASKAAAVVPKATVDVKPQVAPDAAIAVKAEAPAGIMVSSKPAATEIQTALKNAGFYTGLIDGKIGPMTKKAIEAFQKANNLKADGKVGAKTWSILSAYLAPVGDTKAAPLKKR